MIIVDKEPYYLNHNFAGKNLEHEPTGKTWLMLGFDKTECGLVFVKLRDADGKLIIRLLDDLTYFVEA